MTLSHRVLLGCCSFFSHQTSLKKDLCGGFKNTSSNLNEIILFLSKDFAKLCDVTKQSYSVSIVIYTIHRNPEIPLIHISLSIHVHCTELMTLYVYIMWTLLVSWFHVEHYTHTKLSAMTPWENQPLPQFTNLQSQFPTSATKHQMLK